MLVLPIEPTVGGVQPVIAVQSLVIVVEHLSDTRKATVLLRQRLCSSLFFNDIICTALPELIELVRHIALRGWEQVGVVVGDIDAFVSHPVSNRYRRIGPQPEPAMVEFSPFTRYGFFAHRGSVWR